jgi:hypothetical protein
MLTNIAHATALILVASAWGGMLFFAAVFAPSVFGFLKADVAGGFIRRLFPIYYLVIGLVCGIAAVCLFFQLPAARLDVTFLLIVVVGFVVARQYMMPKINHLRDAAIGGDGEAERGFNYWHQASVWLNSIQMLLILFVLIRLGM